MQVKIKALTGMLKEARSGKFTSADAVITFFEGRILSLCLEQYPEPNDFDITKFKNEAVGVAASG